MGQVRAWSGAAVLGWARQVEVWVGSVWHVRASSNMAWHGGGSPPAFFCSLSLAQDEWHHSCVSFFYLVRSPRHLVQLLATNMLPKQYHFYSTFWIPPEKDPVLVDAKLILKYECHWPKEKMYRLRKGGRATVRYFRCGQLAILIATKGKSEFFTAESWKDVRDNPIHVAGYSLGVNRQTEKVSVRLHREAQRKLKRQFTERAAWDLKWWEKSIRAFPFLPFAGVRDNLFTLLRHLNECRKLLRLPPVEWRDCVRKEFTPEPVFLETPPEIEQLLQYETKRK